MIMLIISRAVQGMGGAGVTIMTQGQLLMT